MTGEVDTTLDDAAAVFAGARRRLFGIAYRMLGSSAEAEDVVQETWVRWQTTDRSVVVNPQAFLTTATTRLAINVLQSARSRRETYIGPWLPEPVDTSEDPTLGAERAEALDVAVLALLERLTPTERAAYVLREAFDYAYPEIARIVGVSPTATRQLVSRARKHLAAEPRNTVSTAERRALLEAFLAASFAEIFWAGITTRPIEVNGQEGMAMERDGELIGVLAVTLSSAGLHELMWQLNPEKIAPFRRARAARATPEGSDGSATPGPSATARS